ncbi:uncharacterized protein LOC113509285 isoform X2 [Galleria mellonella]|uniref:Uncharacterized protein LOC113509285 isoform X2 n=1 Tax=Galleria mellonella TaxID=7137 RepID=A0ABM3MUV9_GALME|nr:uncharacterized protein LOC113509285 isoform X2 [Galleria mellonella]
MNDEVNGIHDEPHEDVAASLPTANADRRRPSHDDTKERSRIPTSKFRQALEKFKQGSIDKKNEITRNPSKASSIPRLKDAKITSSPNKQAISNTQPDDHKLEDEFDKIYDEVIDDEPKEVLDNTVSAKIDEPTKLEDKFEEIIHDYEDNKVEPINVDKVKHTRIPQLPKRVIDHENKLTNPDTSPVQSVIEKAKRNEVRTDTKIPMYKDIPQKPPRIRYISKNEDKPNPNNNLNESPKVNLETESQSEGPSVGLNMNNDTNLTPEQSNVNFPEAEPVKVATQEDINRITKENNEKHQNSNVFRSTEIEATPLVNEINAIIDIQPESVSIDNNNPVISEDTPADGNSGHTDTISTEENTNPENNKEIDESKYTPGKVNRILNRIRSYDTKDTKEQSNVVKETPKRKSVLSRIAMFERQEPIAPSGPKPSALNGVPTRKPHVKEANSKLPEIANTKPVIIDEVLKVSIQRDLDSNIIEVKTENPTEEPENKVEIIEEEIKYQEIEVIDAQDDEPIAECNVEESSVTNDGTQPADQAAKNQLDVKDETVPSDVIPELANTIESKPVYVDSRDEIRESIKTEYLDPAPINIQEKELEINNNEDTIPLDEPILDTVKDKPTEQETNVQIVNAEDNVALSRNTDDSNEPERRRRSREEEQVKERPKSLAEIDLGESVKGIVHEMITRMNSFEKIEEPKRGKEIDVKERPRKKSVSMMIALFEQKSTAVKYVTSNPNIERAAAKPTIAAQPTALSDEECDQRIAELSNAKLQYGRATNMTYLVLRNGVEMPVLSLGTSLLDKRLLHHIIGAAIDLGFRAIDTAYIYGNELEVGEAIKAKIDDGTVTREELFITSKLWSTYHRPDLVEVACRASLAAMHLDYFNLYLIHSPMSFKEGKEPIPKIANVIQYSEYDYLDAWYGMEGLVEKGLVRSIGVSNFNSKQLHRVLGRARIKPVINQVECHPYLSQQRLNEFCEERDVKLMCYGVLGSKGTPKELKSSLPPIVDDPLVKVMAAGLDMTIGQLLVRYQIESGHSVVVKASTGAHLWDNLQALEKRLTPEQVDALNALNRNKRTYTFIGMGETHKNYPFSIPF